MPRGPRRIGAIGTGAPLYLRRSKQPAVYLPGALNGNKAAQARTVPAVPSTVPPTPPIEQVRCAIEYGIFHLRDRLQQMFLNIPLLARRPSHIEPPLTAICFDRHRGSGTAASGDAPLAAPAGITTLVLDYVVPLRYRGALRFWGIDVVEGPVAAQDLGWQITINAQRVVPFDPENGGPAPAAFPGFWAGPPFSLDAPDRDVCILLKGGDTVNLTVRNFGAVPLNVAARMGGWVYQPTVDEAGIQVRTTMTDQQ